MRGLLIQKKLILIEVLLKFQMAIYGLGFSVNV